MQHSIIYAMRSFRYYIEILIVLGFSIVIYANTLKNGFVYDDNNTIVNNTLIKDFNNLPKLLKKEYFNVSGEGSYRPLVTLTYFFDYTIYELKSWGYHLTNTVLHTINGVLVYIFLLLFIKPLKTANHSSSTVHLFPSPFFIISVLFVGHPACTEAVNAISFREDLVVFIFYMVTLNLYLFLTSDSNNPKPFTQNKFYFVSCITYSLALLSKEMAATLPLIVYCLEWVYAKKEKRHFISILLNPYIVGYLVVTFIYLCFRFLYFYAPLERYIQAPGLFERVITIPWLILSCLKITVFPVSLSADYQVTLFKYIYTPSFIVPFLIVFFLLFISIKSRNKEVIFGILFFIITLIPVYNIVYITHPLAVRHLYLPVLGFVIAMGSIITSLLRKHSLKPILILILIIGVYSLTVFKRNSIWEDDLSLWSDAIRKAPNSFMAYYGLGSAYLKKGRPDDAIKQYQIALNLKPDDDYANRYREMALELSPNNVTYRYSLGKAYSDNGRFDAAISHYRKVLELNPNDSRIHNDLGNIYAKLGRLDESVSEYNIALSLNPSYSMYHSNLGLAYLKKGLKDKAKKELEIVLRLNPDNLKARKALESLK